jgi:hypothetical protein
MFSVQYSVFQHIGLMYEQYKFCPWCYEYMSMVLWRYVPGVTRSKQYIVIWCYLLSSCVTSCHLVLPLVIWCYLLSSGVTFCHLVLPLVIWCYLLSSGVTSCQLVLPLVNDVTPCILFHKKDKWHNWSKLYYSWIKLTLITMYKSSLHNLGYFLWSTIFFFTIFGYVVVESHLSCIMKQTSFHNCILFHFI